MKIRVLIHKKERHGLKLATVKVAGGCFVARAMRSQIHRQEPRGVRDEANFEVRPTDRFHSHLLDRKEEKITDQLTRCADQWLVISRRPFSVIQFKNGDGFRAREEFAAQTATPQLLRQWGILYPLIKATQPQA